MIHIPFFPRDSKVEPLEDGLGQSTLTDLLWIKRFKGVSKQGIAWKKPDASDKARFNGAADLDKFGDFLIASAKVGQQHWFVVERFWNGWPDPAKFAFFAIEPDGSIWAAADFHHWPKKWDHKGIEL